jgi:hypothetical protein
VEKSRNYSPKTQLQYAVRHEAANLIVLHKIPCHLHARAAAPPRIVTSRCMPAGTLAGTVYALRLDGHCGDDSEVVKDSK